MVNEIPRDLKYSSLRSATVKREKWRKTKITFGEKKLD